ncbi:MAG TPA: hypothetical protein VN040_12825 [Pseudosphingobacterium sp.]|nr:hypothetical protein [Pseudosphingobacterium sp.]
MFGFMIAILLGVACPSHTNNTGNNGTVITIKGGPGGDGGHIPPTIPTKP